MKNYSEMSDFEINKAVALLCTIEGVIINDDGEPVRNVIDDSPGSYSGGDYIEHDFDPCNNPSDAWPIIVENKMWLRELYGTWQVRGFPTTNPNNVITHCDKNPLRCAMIVFLMMKDAEND